LGEKKGFSYFEPRAKFSSRGKTTSFPFLGGTHELWGREKTLGD